MIFPNGILSPLLFHRISPLIFAATDVPPPYPNPALVSHRAAARLPRSALIIFCVAYVLPGLFGRDPWKNADVTAFGYMLEIALGRTSWWAPDLGGLATESGLLPYWLGAFFIKLLSPLIPEALAARIPFSLMLTAALCFTWYGAYHLAHTQAAQPIRFAFGGEAQPADYACAIADGALLALIATLGLLQLGHETTPEILQLLGVCMLLYAIGASPFQFVKACVCAGLALAILVSSGAPAMAVFMGIVGGVSGVQSHYAGARRLSRLILLGIAIYVGMATVFQQQSWQWHIQSKLDNPYDILRLLLWFTWPSWPLALWTLWRWRHHWFRRHILIPLGSALIAIISSLAMGGSDRALMLSIPALAMLAAFALPTLDRATAAAIDWFSVFFFTSVAIVIWVIYMAIQTGFPAQPAANVLKLAPGFQAHFNAPALLIGLCGSISWVWLVHWRAGQNRHALWKSMILPAGGVALCWLLLMSLWLPLLDYARSMRPLVQKVLQHIPAESCIATPGGSKALVASLIYFGKYQVEAAPDSFNTSCEFLLQSERPGAEARGIPPGWMFMAAEQRPTNRIENFVIYRREPSIPLPVPHLSK